MSVDNSAASAAQEPATVSRHLIRTALKGSLGTLDRTSGHPYTSLVLVATEPDGTPVFLISRLAQHTQNLALDERASLLIDGTTGLGDPLTGGRLTLTGYVRPTTSMTAKPRFLARHATASAYAEFPDFAMYALEVTGGHYIGGFGRIVDLEPAELAGRLAPELASAERDIVSHMNADHADAIALYATELAKCEQGEWRMCGIDPGGFDLLHCSKAARIEFTKPVLTPTEARIALVALVKQARSQRDAAAPE